MDGRTAGWVLLAVGIVLFIVAAGLVSRAVRRMRAGGRARGVVVGSEKTYGTSGHGRPYYRPKVRFAGRDGKSHTFTSPLGRGKPYTDGTEVAVLYDPAHPEDAEIAGFATNWLIPLVLAVFGAFSLMTGLGLVSAH